MTALAPPDLSDFANSTKRCMKRKATDFMSGMLSRHPATTRLGFDLLFCSDYQFAMHSFKILFGQSDGLGGVENVDGRTD